MSFFRVPRILFRKSASGLWYPAVSSPEFMRMHVIVPIVQLVDHSRSMNDQVLRSAPKNILHAWSPIVVNARHRLIHWATVSVWSPVFKPREWKFCFRRSDRFLSRLSNVYDTVLRSVKFGQWNRRNVRRSMLRIKREGRVINWKFHLLLIKNFANSTTRLLNFTPRRTRTGTS